MVFSCAGRVRGAVQVRTLPVRSRASPRSFAPVPAPSRRRASCRPASPRAAQRGLMKRASRRIRRLARFIRPRCAARGEAGRHDARRRDGAGTGANERGEARERTGNVRT
ncbi:hypothetical protein CF641_37225 [Burkholderia pseudomallei]|nr:hypothetical protein CF641_37225 [Burkholderia pseudomallei]